MEGEHLIEKKKEYRQLEIKGGYRGGGDAAHTNLNKQLAVSGGRALLFIFLIN